MRAQTKQNVGTRHTSLGLHMIVGAGVFVAADARYHPDRDYKYGRIVTVDQLYSATLVMHRR